MPPNDDQLSEVSADKIKGILAPESPGQSGCVKNSPAGTLPGQGSGKAEGIHPAQNSGYIVLH